MGVVAAAHRNPLGITAYTFAYAGGFALLLLSARDPVTGLPGGLPLAGSRRGIVALDA